ncbi:hypothetical protein BJP40_19935 [Streptomyces sp. CC53]|uniref:hypothetical protein n=1 Tax=Streptomyces sp. CC53 TaxID=1906740 RepID=UPI0008DE191F|nr:hypothetical protein [Streptomyces sp. CC53]OII64611.1 hypothetical protein BJP40_19935 [Streptomyces sp. CC53]
MTDCLLCERNETDGYLCPECTRATARRLDRMPKLYDALAAFLPPGARGSAQYGRTQAVDAPLPAYEPALTLRGPGGIVGILEDWRSAMHADRNWSAPDCSGLTERRVVRAARALSMNLDWVADSWPAAGAFAEEIRDLERDVASIVNPPAPAERGRRLGACPAADPSGNICGAVLRHYPGEKAVTCRWCGCAFPPATWTGLKELIKRDEQEEEPWLSAS